VGPAVSVACGTRSSPITANNWWFELAEFHSSWRSGGEVRGTDAGAGGAPLCRRMQRAFGAAMVRVARPVRDVAGACILQCRFFRIKKGNADNEDCQTERPSMPRKHHNNSIKHCTAGLNSSPLTPPLC
jgi:hypothetical protein